MCELLALARVPGPASVAWLEAFHRRGGQLGPHADGWGIAALTWPRREDGTTAQAPEVDRYREASPASASAFAATVRARLLEGDGDRKAGSEHAERLVLCHIRKATQGARTLRNTQPFVRELGGRLHVFAHNGDLPGAEQAFAVERCGPCRPVGDTDSERLFCALLKALQPLWCAQEPGEVPPLDARMEVVGSVAARARALGPANFFYSDGDAVIVHAHERTQPHGAVGPPGLLLRRLPGEGGAPGGLLLASVPFTLGGDRTEPGVGEAPWEPLAPGELLALREGRVVARTPPP